MSVKRPWLDELFDNVIPLSDDPYINFANQTKNTIPVARFEQELNNIQQRLTALESERNQFKAEVVQNTQTKITDNVTPSAKAIKQSIDEIFTAHR